MGGGGRGGARLGLGLGLCRLKNMYRQTGLVFGFLLEQSVNLGDAQCISV